MAGRRLGWLLAGALAVGWLVSSLPDADAPTPVMSREPAAPVAHPKPAPPSPRKPVTAPPLPAKQQTERSVVREPSVVAPKPVTYFANAKVRMRQSPSTDAKVIRTLATGELVYSLEVQPPWHRIVDGAGREGWVHGQYLAGSAPAPSRAAPLVSPPAQRVSPLTARTQPVPARTGEPIRDPRVGNCDCPYDRKRNGHRCGGSSAWSRPGGRSPVCFVGE
jgi:hypothetical protein